MVSGSKTRLNSAIGNAKAKNAIQSVFSTRNTDSEWKVKRISNGIALFVHPAQVVANRVSL